MTGSDDVVAIGRFLLAGTLFGLIYGLITYKALDADD